MKIVDEKSFKIILGTENPNFKNILGSKLRFDGYTIEFSTSGFEILHIIESINDINLIILHENMCDMPSFEIISLVRNTKTKAELPIIYVSKIKNAEEVKEIILAGANDYIFQSTNVAQITEKAKKYFQNLNNS